MVDVTNIIVAVISGATAVMCAVIAANQRKSERRRSDAQGRMEIILEGVEACLYGVHELGANGRTTEAIKKLEAYKNTKAAK